jgi:hypothetical protein
VSDSRVGNARSATVKSTAGELRPVAEGNAKGGGSDGGGGDGAGGPPAAAALSASAIALAALPPSPLLMLPSSEPPLDAA